jgi:3-phosphoshikimate 1-carboxyvinyltransferase
MVLTSIRERGFAAVMEALELTEAAEIRLDFCDLTKEETINIFSGDKWLIATCRPSELISDNEVVSKLKSALTGAARSTYPDRKFIDLDIDSPEFVKERISRIVKDSGAKLILSHHDFERTPSVEILEEIIVQMLNHADIAKIAVMANSTQDGAAIMDLYRKFPPERLLAFCMGDKGRFTRRLCLELGAPFSYASLNDKSETAPGQFTYSELKKILCPENFPFLFGNGQIKPELWAPASKSHAQRVILAASLAKGKTTIYNYSACNDTEAACILFGLLGVKTIHDSTARTLKIESPGAESLKKFISDTHGDTLEIFTGESGLLTRLVIPVFALLCAGTGKKVKITGHGTIMNREFAESEEVLNQLGFNVRSLNNKLPLTIEWNGSQSSGEIKISGREGSQLISGLLMALPLSDNHFTLSVAKPSSTPYIDTTLSVLHNFGLKSTNDGYRKYETEPGIYLPQQRIEAEGDWSSASALLIAGAIGNGTKIYNLKRGSGQADEKIAEILLSAGANLTAGSNYEGFRKEFIEVKPSATLLKSFECDATDSPDLFPSLVALAINCKGTSRIKGVERLFNKESNRAEALYAEYSKMGADIRFEGDTMIVTGGTIYGGRCFSYNDHRIAMSLRVAAIVAEGELYTDNAGCIAKSFPDFLSCFIN